jgi:hypothetical protein
MARSAFLLLPAALALATSDARAQSTVLPGDAPAYAWRTALFQGSGASSLEDFRGKPVLVDFWGTR